MTSLPQGNLAVLVWSDDGQIKSLANDDGQIPIIVDAQGTVQNVNIASSDIDVPVSIDAQTQTLDVNLESSDIELDVNVQNWLSSIIAQGYSYYDGSFRKSPFSFGVSDVVNDSASDTGVSAGTNNLSLSTVPSGEIWVMTHWGCYCSTSNPTRMIAFVHTTAGDVTIKRDLTTDPQEGLWSGAWIVLIPGQYLKMRFISCGAGDDIYANAHGFIMEYSA